VNEIGADAHQNAYCFRLRPKNQERK